MTTPTDPRALVERLTAMKDSGHRTIGGGSCGWRDGKPHSEIWGNEPIMVPVNPDGPEAAATITRLTAEVEGLREVLADMLDGRAGARNAARATLDRP